MCCGCMTACRWCVCKVAGGCGCGCPSVPHTMVQVLDHVRWGRVCVCAHHGTLRRHPATARSALNPGTVERDGAWGVHVRSGQRTLLAPRTPNEHPHPSSSSRSVHTPCTARLGCQQGDAQSSQVGGHRAVLCRHRPAVCGAPGLLRPGPQAVCRPHCACTMYPVFWPQAHPHTCLWTPPTPPASLVP